MKKLPEAILKIEKKNIKSLCTTNEKGKFSAKRAMVYQLQAHEVHTLSTISMLYIFK
jgi:hypothetical protein